MDFSNHWKFVQILEVRKISKFYVKINKYFLQFFKNLTLYSITLSNEKVRKNVNFYELPENLLIFT
jgi:hypothetical protein